MTKVIVKHRLFTWFEQVPNTIQPGGPDVNVERIAHMGDEIDIPDDNPHLARGRQDDIDAFYTDEEADKIREGTYDGSDAGILARFRSGQRSAPQIEGIEGEGPQVGTLTTEELADWISENRPNVDQTVALAGDDLESIEKVLDAENIATDGDPRKGVVDRLESKMKAATA